MEEIYQRRNLNRHFINHHLMPNPAKLSAAVWRKRATAYGFALAISALTLQMRVSLTPWVGKRPVLMMFMLPIIFSAYVGGLGPGLLSTLLCAAGAYYFLFADAHNLLLFQGSVNLWQLVMLVVTGGLVSLLIGALYRSGQRQTETQAQLSHSLSLLRATIEASSDGLLVVDNHNRVTAYNRRFLELWNISKETAEQGEAVLLRKLVQAQLSEPEEFLRRVEEHYTHPEQVSLDTLKFKDGRVFERVSHPQRLGETVVGRVWSFRDVTTRKQAEKAVLEREQLLQQVIDLVPHFIFAKDRQSRTLFANRARAEANGMTPEEMVGRTDRDFVADQEQGEAFMRDDREVIESGKPKFIPEERLRRRDGRLRILETIKVPFTMPGTNEPALLGVAVDITDRIQAEEAVKHERQLLRQLIDLMPDLIFVKDTESRFLVVNESLARSYGQSPAAMMNRTDADFLPAELAAGFRASELRVMAADSFVPLEDTIAFPDGNTRTMVTNMVAFRDNQGKLLGVVGIGRDVTQSKIDLNRQHLLEEQLRQAQKMEAIGQLAGGVAHDFNNILAVIQMQAELFKMDAQASKEQAACLNEIQTAANRGANLTRQLLLFSRRQRLQPRELDLSDSITAMTKMLRRVLGEDIQIQFKYASQPLIIHADAGMMDQVLMNLTLNSRDAMPSGGQLIIETAAVELDELAVLQSAQARPGSFARLRVSDTGCGIPPELLPRIFEPFFTTKDVGKGTGLGLATVFSIVQQHQGWINVVSDPQRGTTFDIYLPRLAKSSCPATEPAASPTAFTGGHETILLVEDDDALRSSVRHCLAQLGYRLLEAASGAAALEVWQQHRNEIRLLLTDLIMPGGMTGRELGERLQRENPKLAIVYVSGYSADIFTKDYPPGPGIAFLAKPFPAQALARTIRAQLDDLGKAGAAGG